jgi:hypothetical protein
MGFKPCLEVFIVWIAFAPSCEWITIKAKEHARMTSLINMMPHLISKGVYMEIVCQMEVVPE